ALAGLGALRHLDLQFSRLRQIIARDAEAPRGHLLDRAIARVAVGVERVARGVFAALAGVALAADAVHRNRERLVRLLADRAVGHRAGLEALDDLVDRLDLVDRHRLRRGLEIHQRPQRGDALGLVV